MKSILLILSCFLSANAVAQLQGEVTVHWKGTDTVRITIGSQEAVYGPNGANTLLLPANERLLVLVKNRFGLFRAERYLTITGKGDVEVELRGLDVQMKFTAALRQYPWADNIAANMMLVTGGSYKMGNDSGATNERPAHTVRLKSFFISRYEVTNEQWKTVMGSDTAYFRTCAQCPVENITWDNAQRFIDRLNQLTGKRYRLPTEAEWEYAARGGNETANNIYCGSNTLSDVSWYSSNSEKKTHPVGTKMPNELGLYDMSGNVWEWCYDWYGDMYYSTSATDNPKGPLSGDVHVLRGGSWFDFDIECRSTNRFTPSADYRLYILGFRLAMDGE